MKAPTMDALILLPKEMALEKHFLVHNWRVTKWLLILFFSSFAISLGFSLFLETYLDAGLEIFGILFTLGFFFARKSIFNRSDYLFHILGFLATQLIGITAIAHLGVLFSWTLVYVVVVHFYQMPRKWVLLVLLFTAVCLLGRWYIDPSSWILFFGFGLFLPSAVIAFFSTSSASENRSEEFIEAWLKFKLDKEHSRMKAELDHAQEIQLSMLPTANPDIQGLDVASISIPASEVGGDYYDYFPLDGKKLTIVIGDVSGHGVASGLVLSGVRSCLYLLKEGLPSPAALLGKLNRMLKQTTDKRMFMTMLTAVIDLETNEMTYATAGHPLLYHFRHQDKSVHDIKERALPLGAIMKATYPEASLHFSSGDYLLFYTDGIFEAADRDHAEYGLKRLHDKFRQTASKGGTAEAVRNFILEDIRKFIGFQEQLDDMTMVVVKVG